jgi:hypothetical protein
MPSLNGGGAASSRWPFPRCETSQNEVSGTANCRAEILWLATDLAETFPLGSRVQPPRNTHYSPEFCRFGCVIKDSASRLLRGDRNGRHWDEYQSGWSRARASEFAADSPLEGIGFELVWGFSCQVVVFGLM